MSGFDNTTFQHQEYIQKVQSVIYSNSWLFDQTIFEQVDPAMCPGGSRITIPVEYATTFNGGTFSYADAMPASDELSEVAGYFNKDAYQGSARIFKLQQAQMEMNRNGYEVRGQSREQQALDRAGKNLRDNIVTTAVTDLIAQVDSAGTWSDAALTRSTYSLASFEDTAGGVIDNNRMEDAIEALGNTTYGPVPEEDLLWLLPRNQLTNVARNATGSAGTELNDALKWFGASSEGQANIDAGRTYRVKSFGGIQLMVVPDMSTTDVLLVDKQVVKVFNWIDMDLIDKSPGVMAYQNLWHLVMGTNLIALNPRRCAKFSGLTA